MAMSENMQLSVQSSEMRATTRLGGVQLTIDVKVQCTPNDLDELGHKLRKVIRDFNEPEKKSETHTPPAPAADEGAGK